MKRIMAIAVLAAILLSGCMKAGDPEPLPATFDEAPTAPRTEAPTEPPTEPPTLDELAQAEYNRILDSDPTGFAVLDGVTVLSQFNSMQAACEALALTAALSYYGYELDIDDIVDDYMVYSDNFVTGYCGNPRRFYDGSGIYPPGMLTTSWNFIEENDADLYPFDTTGLSMDELYRFVDAGCPVLVWTTYDRGYPYIEHSREYEGVWYPWYDSEHCVCLIGYDAEDNEVKLADSWGGVTKWEGAARFEDVYDRIGRFSMVLMDTSDLKYE